MPATSRHYLTRFTTALATCPVAARALLKGSLIALLTLAIGSCTNDPSEPRLPTEPQPTPALSANLSAATSTAAAGSSICIAFTRLRSDTEAQLAADSTNADLQAQLAEVTAMVDDVCH